MSLKSNQQGYLGVVTVLIVTVIVLGAGLTMALLARNQLLSQFSLDQSEAVLQKADGCMEEAYYRLKESSSYAGGTIPYADGSCTLTISGSGSTRTIISTLTIGSFTRIVSSDITLKSNVDTTTEGVNLTEWAQQ